ncbi:MAG: hypothetical protein HGA80_07650 [Candidatus Omnitrophica bacterium]|nr:hypothetical protein [Candidatus Omnitrophota bacterium]
MCWVTPVTLTEEKLNVLLSAGLGKVLMGIQADSVRILKGLYGRNISNEGVVRAARTLAKYRDRMEPPSYDIIFCNPMES